MSSAAEDRVAYHEAGHAVMAEMCRLPFQHVTIDADKDSLGHALMSQTFKYLPCGLLVMVLLSGEAAERRWRGDAIHHTEDSRQARILVAAIGDVVQHDEAALGAQVDAWRQCVSEQISEQWPWVEAVAGALRARRRLLQADVVALYRSMSPPAERVTA